MKEKIKIKTNNKKIKEITLKNKIYHHPLKTNWIDI